MDTSQIYFSPYSHVHVLLVFRNSRTWVHLYSHVHVAFHIFWNIQVYTYNVCIQTRMWALFVHPNCQLPRVNHQNISHIYTFTHYLFSEINAHELICISHMKVAKHIFWYIYYELIFWYTYYGLITYNKHVRDLVCISCVKCHESRLISTMFTRSCFTYFEVKWIFTCVYMYMYMCIYIQHIYTYAYIYFLIYLCLFCMSLLIYIGLIYMSLCVCIRTTIKFSNTLPWMSNYTTLYVSFRVYMSLFYVTFQHKSLFCMSLLIHIGPFYTSHLKSIGLIYMSLFKCLYTQIELSQTLPFITSADLPMNQNHVHTHTHTHTHTIRYVVGKTIHESSENGGEGGGGLGRYEWEHFWLIACVWLKCESLFLSFSLCATTCNKGSTN